MWCGTCQSEIVTEVASDHRRVSCSICGSTLGETAASQAEIDEPAPQAERTTQARELLDRWAKTPLFDPFGPGRQQPDRVEPAGEHAGEHASEGDIEQQSEAASTDSTAADQSRTLSDSQSTPSEGGSPGPASSQELDRLTEEILSRVSQITSSIRQPSTADESGTDIPITATGTRPAQQVDACFENYPDTVTPAAGGTGGVHVPSETTAENLSGSSSALDTTGRQHHFDAAGNPLTAYPAQAGQELPPELRFEPAQPQNSIPAPHTGFSGTAPAAQPGPAQASGFVGGIGQALAYLGILGLTAGTSLVIVGYFGGPAHYAPTGWLITTIGQMMLFLGVVTLVSTGIEQTQAEIRQSLVETCHEISAKIDRIGEPLTNVDSSNRKAEITPHTRMQAPVDADASESPRQQTP